MSDNEIIQAIERLGASRRAGDPAVKILIDALQKQGDFVGGDAYTAGDISGSTGIAIGRNIRMVINQVDLPAETVAALLDVRNALGGSLGLDPDRYRLGTLMLDKTHDFVGREHIFEAMDQFLHRQPSGYLIIDGDPGLGKSAILAEYVRRSGCIAHFNVRALGIVNAWQFLENVCTQIIVDFGLPYTALPSNATQDGVFLSRLLQEASARLAPGERLVIAVDALDEVDLKTHPDGANILYLPAMLPDGVYFVMTRRRVDVPLVVQAPQALLDLIKFPAENRNDVEAYLRRCVGRPGLQAWIDRQGLKVTAFISTLADLSENNFMYLRYMLPEIERGAYQDLEVRELPVGLEGYYEDHWRRMGMKDKPLPRVKIRIVYILSEVQQPVSRKLISSFANSEALCVDELMVQEVLDEWNQFLHEQSHPDGTRYSVYHVSFRDFLHRKDIVQAAGVTIQGIHALIADDLWAGLFEDG